MRQCGKRLLYTGTWWLKVGNQLTLERPQAAFTRRAHCVVLSFQPAADRGCEPAPHATLAVPRRGEGEGGDGGGGAGGGGLEAILVVERRNW
jgi:hypothetical protein